MVKMYKVMMGDVVLFGPVPEVEYSRVQSFVASLAPAIKSKCNVVAVSPSKNAGTEAAVLKPAAKKPSTTNNQGRQPAKVPTASEDINKVFGTYLEGGGQTDFWKPKDGRNLVRILPIGGVLPTDWVTPYPLLISGVHPNVGLSLRETVYCARLTHSKACPICNFVWKLYNTKNDDDIRLAKNIRAYNRVIANIIDLSNVEAGVQKFAFGKTLARIILSYMDDEEFKPLLDAERGHNFVVIKKIVDGYPNYDESKFEVRTSSLSQIYPNWKAEAFDLKKEIVEKSYDELMAILIDTKKALLTTSPDEIINAGARPRRAATAGAPVGEDVVVEEVSAEDIAKKLGQI